MVVCSLVRRGRCFFFFGDLRMCVKMCSREKMYIRAGPCSPSHGRYMWGPRLQGKACMIALNCYYGRTHSSCGTCTGTCSAQPSKTFLCECSAPPLKIDETQTYQRNHTALGNKKKNQVVAGVRHTRSNATYCNAVQAHVPSQRTCRRRGAKLALPMAAPPGTELHASRAPLAHKFRISVRQDHRSR